MSSTRHAKDDSVFHQARYASSPEFERGLLANLVAKRCALIDAKSDRELIWFIQYLSHQDGGLAAVAKDLMAKFPDRIHTAAMGKFGTKAGTVYHLNQVQAVRAELPYFSACRFPVAGEEDFGSIMAAHPEAPASVMAKSALGLDAGSGNNAALPDGYPVENFIRLCQQAAGDELEDYLREICLDPANSLEHGPWYFPGLIDALREYQSRFTKAQSAGVVITALGKKVCEVLDYTAYSRRLSLMEGGPRLGKTFAAKAWCSKHPGQARFIEVPPSNDDSTFFRAIARGLGLGNFLNYKVGQIRERVESVLLTGNILLVMDEAQRLWPQRNIRQGFPARIVWVMSMANAGVPICMITTPQFFDLQKAVEKTGWNSAQLTGRFIHYQPLPADLTAEDLQAVAKAVLPEAGATVLRALAAYAQSSSRYLAAIDSIATRARYIAMRAGREEATADDVRLAMQESVIPSDTRLKCALDAVKNRKPGRMKAMPALPLMPADALLAAQDGTENLTTAGNRLAHCTGGSASRVPGASLIEA